MLRALVDSLAAGRRTLPRVFWTVWWGTLVNRLGGFVVPLLTYYLTRERHVALADAGAIVSLFGVGAIGASLVGGILTDRVGRRTTLLLSLFGGAATMLALGVVRSPGAIAIAALAQGFAGELYRPAVGALVSDVVPAADRATAFGLLYWAINLGFAIASVLAGLVATWSYTALFLLDAATTAAYGVIVALAVPETRPAHADPTSDARAAISLLDVLRDRVFMTFVAFTFVSAAIQFQSSAALSAHMAAQNHSAATFGAVMAVNGVMIVFLQPWISGHLAHRDPSRVLAGSAVVLGVGFFLHGVGAAVALHVAAVAVWTVGEMVASPTNSTVIAAMSPPQARGRYQGVFSMSFATAAALGPYFGSRVLAAGGPHVLWSACLGLGLAIAAGLMLTAPARRRRCADAS